MSQLTRFQEAEEATNIAQLEAMREHAIKQREEKRLEKAREANAIRRKVKAEKVKKQDAFKHHKEKIMEHGKKDVIEKKSHDLEREYLERNRTSAHLKREAGWQEKSQNQINNILLEAEEDRKFEEQAKKEARMRVILDMRRAAKQRVETEERQEDENVQREEERQARAARTRAEEMHRIHDIKDELRENLAYKKEMMEMGKRAPLDRDDLVFTLVPMPSVGELLVTCRSEVNEIKYLQKANLEGLSKLYGMPPLLYARQLNQAHADKKLSAPTAVMLPTA